MKPDLTASDNPAKVMRQIELWAREINDDRRKHGHAIFKTESDIASLAYGAYETLETGEKASIAKQALGNPKSEPARREQEKLTRAFLTIKTCLEGLTRRQVTARMEGRHEEADAIDAIRYDQEQKLTRRTIELNKVKRQKGKRGNPRDKFAVRYSGLAMVPIVRAIIGPNAKLIFKTSTTTNAIKKTGKRKGKRVHIIAESNFTKIAGSLLSRLRPQIKFTGKDLDWIAAVYAKQNGEPITEKQQRLIAPWLFDKNGNSVPQREKQTIGSLWPE
jgi:hypothetical protein